MQLALPKYEFNIRENTDGRKEIFDSFRRKYIVLTPEEWVRQHFLRYLVEEKGFPSSLIAVEKSIMVNQMPKRFDAMAYGKSGKPLILMEFKSPKVKLNQEVIEQVSRYNSSLQLSYLLISNGLKHYCCQLDFSNNNFKILDHIPSFEMLDEN